MKDVGFGSVLLAALFGVASASSISTREIRKRIYTYPSHVNTSPGSYIIQFEDDAPDNHANHYHAMSGVDVNHQYSEVFHGISVRTDDSIDPLQLASVEKVKRVWPVRHYTIASQCGKSSGAPDPYLHKPTGVERAVEELGLSGKGVHIGIVDTGVDYTHPELGGCWKTEGCMWQYGSDLVGDDFNPPIGNTDTNPGPDPMDCVGHGTHVSGIIAGQGPNVRGVAPNVTLGMYRVFGCPAASGASGTSDEVLIKAFEMAFSDKSDIISLSLGGDSWPDEPISVAAASLASKGTVVVAAAGNDGKGGLFTASAPAVANGVISVGSVSSWNYTVMEVSVSNSASSNSVITTLSTSLGRVFKFDSETPLVAPTFTANKTDCAIVEEDLTGKVAVYTRSTSCSFRVVAKALDVAGAAGMILINSQPGLYYPTLEGIKASFISVTTEDGNLIMDTIAAGPATIKGPTSKPFDIPAPSEAGQLSYFSSMGPDPHLEITPHVLAPGGNIYSTFPTKLGSYFVFSGTSMACPYVAGAVALLKEARPSLSVSEVDEIISITAKPLVNSSTGIVEHPYKGGSGLINVYDAVKSRATIDPPRISINSTTQGLLTSRAGTSLGDTRWSARAISLTNTDKSNDMHVSIDNSGSASLSLYYPNGSIAYTPLAFGGNGLIGGSDNTLPTIQLYDAPATVPAGQTQEYTINIIAPVALNDTNGWFFGGMIDFKLQWGSETSTSVYSVPYAGLHGDYSKLDVLAPPDSGYPMIGSGDSEPFDPATLVITGEVTVFALFSMAVPSPLGIIQLIDSTNKAVGYLPTGYMKYVPHTCPLCTLPALPIPINGTVFTDEELTNPVQAPAGKYHVHAAFLRPLGDANNSDDFHVWESQEFTIA
ncbi:hypothetical protein IW140_004610 [Coemansia sp. RSA 1813]|nr:hypothetical protein EV178_002154 [Coemansia sp. RSA 1646]KAJ1767448.1 hypothetical protein LPJ74_005362 [Coemansia sp. RSA 1843]KAJ2090346.1 hypothetical protein IW138_002772 [Coemansia sp. RSA 986]KAJ2215532.1 hypothetical protein EV179_002125 [Coemansia sp. RSA 487]KAJ2567185.1 hypothetical protein IW140_004610 [Coemansia sp. RSA 1813]